MRWAVPAVLGLLAFGGLLSVRLDPPQEPALIPLFQAPVVDPDAPGTLLAQSASGSGARLVEVPVLRPGPIAAGSHVVAEARLAPPGPRFGLEGRHAAVLAFHAVAGDGRLLASSSAPAELAPFRLHGDFRHTGPVALDLGEGPPTPGASRLPQPLSFLAPALREALAGQPAGGVAVVRIEAGLPADLYGPVTVAVQLVRLLSAP